MDSGGETVELNGQAEGAEPAAERVGPGAGRGAAGRGQGARGSGQGPPGTSVLSARQERRPSRFCNPCRGGGAAASLAFCLDSGRRAAGCTKPSEPR